MNGTYVGIVRGRGQLTLPEQLRKKLNWLSKNSAVEIWAKNLGEVVLRPARQNPDLWNTVWEGIEESRSYESTHISNLSQKISVDRNR